MDKCLDDVRNSLTGDLDRIHLLTKKDLRSIGNAEGILQREKLHANDAVSISLWVEEDKSSKRNLAIFYKAQGSSFPPLNDEDLMLVIMSPPQKEMYEKFGGKKICVDSTHGTNAYDFQLSTIMVVDEFGAGFPAAFCLSNRIDQTSMNVFFDSVAKATTTTTPDIFMSDDAPAFYNAWKTINGDAKRQLLCTWHVDRNWRKALSKIPSKEKKASVYKFARTLLEEMEETKFKMLLESFLEELQADVDTQEFGIYFERVYANRPESWAYSYRLGSGINTNMYLEAMHKVLKHVYMEGKKCKRLDTCLSHLLKMVRDRIFSRLTQLIKGGKSSKINIIHNRHKKSLDLSSSLESLNSTSWKIKSESSSNFYMVEKLACDCNNCLLKCFYCKVCVHVYSCTCIDYQIQLNMCKHIHFVHCKQSTKSEVPILEAAPLETEVNAQIQSLILGTPKTTTVGVKNKLELALSMIEKNEYDPEINMKVNKMMDNILSLLSTSGSNKISLEAKGENEPPNKRIKLQPRFYSTKKKRISVKSKPTINYKQSLVKCVVEKVDTPLIHDEFDHSYTRM